MNPLTQKYLGYLADLEAKNPVYSDILFRQPGIPSLLDGSKTNIQTTTEPTPGMYGIEDDPSAYAGRLGTLGQIGKTYGIMSGLSMFSPPAAVGYAGYQAGKGLMGLIGSLFGGSGPGPSVGSGLSAPTSAPPGVGPGESASPGEATTSAGSAADPGTAGDPF